ncbi:protein-tyrosine phosphatase-like protein [Absidia repens]|uniref:Protein tyrosine phosphatase type IVA 3 n=1 Tax=Absidia repens TaxID=90262 RepID=A0A1X2IKG9_9FUNG|nr:protein-tyrosine phosphatase-like protein [Absidia repens]
MVRSNTPLGYVVSVINHDQIPIQFLIMDCPTEYTLPFYLAEFHKYQVKTVVRCCQPTYNADYLLECGIDFLDLPFHDGGIPSNTKIAEWIQLINKYVTHPAYSTPTLKLDGSIIKPTIAVHCVAGLGRAPLLCALAMIELGMTSSGAIYFIRQKRRGAFNKRQRSFLDLYQQSTKRRRSVGGHRRRSSSSSDLPAISSALSVFSWGGRMVLKLTQKIPTHQRHRQGI